MNIDIICKNSIWGAVESLIFSSVWDCSVWDYSVVDSFIWNSVETPVWTSINRNTLKSLKDYEY